MSVPKALRGCTKATVVPRDPGLGRSSISSAPAARMCSMAAAQSRDPVADVVDALAFALEEPRHGRGVGSRAEQLDERLGHAQKGLLDAVVLDHLPVGHLCTEG